MVSDIPGTRIRQYRRDMGVTQAALARKVGISPSYLNLIEWNKRPIAGTLLRKIAEALDLTGRSPAARSAGPTRQGRSRAAPSYQASSRSGSDVRAVSAMENSLFYSTGECG